METTLIKILKDVLNIESEISPHMEFNLFEYDSFTKVNLIIAIELYSDVESVEFDELIACDSFQDIIDLAEKLKEK